MDEMNEEEVREFIARHRFATLGLARDNRAYAVPVFYGFDGNAFYFHSHPGQKTDFLETTEDACLLITAVRSEDVWGSVMVFGPIHEATADYERLVAMDALLALPNPPATGRSVFGEPARPPWNVAFYVLTPRRITGRKSAPPPLSREALELAYRGM